MRFSANPAAWALVAGLFVLAACSTASVDEVATSELTLNDERVAELREPDLIANYYPAESDGPGPAILLLGGSEGGLSPLVAKEAFELRGAGYSVLQLSYYRSPAQSENLEMVPLEVFDRGLDWLGARPEVDVGRIGIMGTSKGAEAALITAERHSQAFAAVVAVVPSNVSWQGINWAFDGRPPEASWSLDGEAYPYLPYGAWEAEKGLYSLYDNGLNTVSEYEDALIEIELVEAPVLLICGEADTLWPSCPMSEALAARAIRLNGPEVEVLVYTDAGHGSGGAPSDAYEPSMANEDSTYGGTKGANQAAREDGWPKTLAFFEAALK